MRENQYPNTSSGPVAVVCKDGVSRAGVYCVASYCFDQVAVSREGGRKQADVYQAVKLVKKVRPKLITGIEEYKYCYELIQTFVEKYRMLEKTSLVDRVCIECNLFLKMFNLAIFSCKLPSQLALLCHNFFRGQVIEFQRLLELKLKKELLLRLQKWTMKKS